MSIDVLVLLPFLDASFFTFFFVFGICGAPLYFWTVEYSPPYQTIFFLKIFFLERFSIHSTIMSRAPWHIAVMKEVLKLTVCLGGPIALTYWTTLPGRKEWIKKTVSFFLPFFESGLSSFICSSLQFPIYPTYEDVPVRTNFLGTELPVAKKQSVT
jgi:hypothetical protein